MMQVVIKQLSQLGYVYHYIIEKISTCCNDTLPSQTSLSLKTIIKMKPASRQAGLLEECPHYILIIIFQTVLDQSRDAWSGRLVFNDLVSRANLISMMTVLLLQGIYDESMVIDGIINLRNPFLGQVSAIQLTVYCHKVTIQHQIVKISKTAVS